MFKGTSSYYKPSADEQKELHKLGLTVSGVVLSFDIAVILGVHFKAGEWGRTRCGSVVVTTLKGKTRYCIVGRFLQVGSGCVACGLTWFAPQRYPYYPNPLVVVSSITNCDIEPCVLPVRDIIPTRVFIEPHLDGVNYNLIRESGTDVV